MCQIYVPYIFEYKPRVFYLKRTIKFTPRLILKSLRKLGRKINTNLTTVPGLAVLIYAAVTCDLHTF